MRLANGTTIVLAEDDRATRESLTRALEMEGYAVFPVGDGVAALQAVSSHHPDVAVLDVMMPALDGLEVCRTLRAGGDRLAVLMLTARTEVRDRVDGLDAGADDYLTKPFSLDELLARIRALVRRNTPEDAGSPVEVAGVRIDPAGRQAWRAGRMLSLTKTEFDLLELLVRNAGQVLPHRVVYERIWGYDFGADSKNLAVYVGYLRRKTEEAGEPRVIHTVRGVGYTLRAP